MTTHQNSLDTDISSIPHIGFDADKLRFLLQFATLAPSICNSQPWLWQIEGNEATLFADRSRQLGVSDPLGRELVISCGASLQILRLAVRASGYADIVAYPPQSSTQPGQFEALACVRLAGRREANPDDVRLFRAVTKRHTDRHIFQNQPLPSDLLQDLQNEAAREAVTLHLVTDKTRRAALVDMIVRGDLVTSHDAAYRQERARWMRSNSSERKDGVPGYALGQSDAVSLFTPYAEILFDRSEAQADRDWLLAGSAPALAVLSTGADLTTDWLATGQALMRVLLRATCEGVSASFFNAPVEVSGLWPHLRFFLGEEGFPQLLFRLGYGSETRATPRRPVEDVTL
jgi:nitroreductase